MTKETRCSRKSASDNKVYRYLENSNRLDHTETLDSSGQTLPGKPERELIYNDAGRLFRLLEDGVPVAEYIYNDPGQRNRKTVFDPNGSVNSITIYHYNLNGELIGETQEDGQAIKDYIHAKGQPVAQIDYDASTNQETIQYLYTDHLYTPRLATDQNRTVTWRWEGDAFGDTGPQSFGATIHLRFPGQYFDSETWLYYNWHRYYDSYTGRYIASDPVGLEGGLNNYGYARQNPARFVDQTGKFVPAILICLAGPCETAVAVAAAIEAGIIYYTAKAFNELSNCPIFLNENDDGLSDDALVCRGGRCTSKNFKEGMWVTVDENGNLNCVSVNSADGKSVDELTDGIQNGQVGVTTVGDVRAAWGNVIPSTNERNPNHATLNGITPQQAQDIFTPTIPNPNAIR